MCDYKIYKLYSKKNPDKLYIGSTKRKLSIRLGQHKYRVVHGLNCGKLPILFSNDDVVIELIEIIQNVSKEDLLNREDYYIKQYGFYNSKGSKKYTLNKAAADQKKYRDKNKEFVNRKTTCECGAIVYRRHLKSHKKRKKHLDAMELLLK